MPMYRNPALNQDQIGMVVVLDLLVWLVHLLEGHLGDPFLYLLPLVLLKKRLRNFGPSFSYASDPAFRNAPHT